MGTLVITNGAAVNMGVQALVRAPESLLLGVHIGVELLGHVAILC